MRCKYRVLRRAQPHSGVKYLARLPVTTLLVVTTVYLNDHVRGEIYPSITMPVRAIFRLFPRQLGCADIKRGHHSADLSLHGAAATRHVGIATEDDDGTTCQPREPTQRGLSFRFAIHQCLHSQRDVGQYGERVH